MKLKDQVAVITGGSNGIGRAIAERFIKEGARVVVLDTEKPDYPANFIQTDISNEKQIEKAFNKIKDLDILINNAGVYFQASVEKTSEEQLRKIIDINFKGTYLMCKHALPLIKGNKGTIINISSGLGIVAEPESPAYCSTKAAIIMLTKCMAQEYAKLGVRVNTVLPGPIDTRLLRNALGSQKNVEEYAKINPMRRIGSSEEVANVVTFLASKEAGYITGGLYSVDGGESTSSLYSK